MKIKDKKWLAAALVAIAILGAVAFIGQNTELRASILGGADTYGSGGSTTESSSALITKTASFDGTRDCNPPSGLDECIYSTNTVDGVKSQAWLSWEEVPNRVEPDYNMEVSCVGDYIYFAEGNPDPQADYSPSGTDFNPRYQDLGLEYGGMDIPIGEKAPLENGFTIICSDTNEDSGQGWSAQWVAHTFDSVQKAEKDSDGDGVPDSEDEFPLNPECAEDSDGDGVCDNKDAFPNDPSKQYDQDNDGVADSVDQCPRTPGDSQFNGCPDSDGDGVPDNQDSCPNEGDQGFGVKENGCPVEDSDGDGVGDDVDQCPGTPVEASVDNKGCALDSDNDGVLNYQDECPNTGDPKLGVNDQGCAVQDEDQDGVTDSVDECPQTWGSKTNGCPTFVDQIINTLGLRGLLG